MALPAGFLTAPKTTIGTAPLIVRGNPPLNAATHAQRKIAFGVGESVQLVEQSAAHSIIDLSIAKENGKYMIYAPAGSGDVGPAYYLPWKEGHAYAITLGSGANFFTTAHMSSCALLIGGTPAAPTVIHANCGNSKRIDDSAAKSLQIDNYTSLYNNLLQALVTDGILPGNSSATPIAMHDPGVYMTGAKAGYTAVIGVRTGANWSFFYNVNNGLTGFTGQLWPTYDKFPY